MIKLFNVKKEYSTNNLAIENVSFTINKGEFVFFIGPSGAGKTTLLKLIFGQERPTSGSILVNDVNIGRIKDPYLAFVRRQIGVVFQDFKLIPYKTVQENIEYPLVVSGESRKVIIEKTTTILSKLGILKYKNVLTRSLAGGEQQRVAVARAIINNPFLVIADEPTGNLDKDYAYNIMDIFKEINNYGTTVLIATHDMDIVHKYRGKIISLKDGKMVESLI